MDLPEPRRRLLLRLKIGGPAAIAALAADLGTTGEAVRQQLLSLVRENLVLHEAAAAGAAGRPANVYRLSAAGEKLFPRKYDDLLLLLVDSVRNELGEEALTRLLTRLTDVRVQALESAMQGLDLPARVRALGALYESDDPFLTTETVDGGFRIIERNCPFLEVAMQRPLLCSSTVSVLTRLLGHEVVRDERFQDGHGRCAFHVHADRPVDVARLRFQREPRSA